MKTFLLSVLVLMIGVQAAHPVQAGDLCRTRSAPRPATAVPAPQSPRPQPQQPQAVPLPQPSASDEPIWDLPGDKRNRLKNPAVPGKEGSAEAFAPASNGVRIPAALSERMMQAGTVRQTILASNARLIAKRAELLRWDREAQEKFERIFGTADEATRQRVLGRLEQEIVQNQKLVATLTENMSMELYFQTKRKP